MADEETTTYESLLEASGISVGASEVYVDRNVVFSTCFDQLIV